MNKSVYSLVLSDAVVAEVDKLAYQHSTNRSNMINQILADYVSYTTPEKRMHEVFSRMEDLLLSDNFAHNAFQLLGLPSDTMFNVRSAIQYKYNPSVKYSVELYRQRQEDGTFGVLKVGLRTQNQTLIALMSDFYQKWHAIESKYFDGIEASSDGERYVRKLKLGFNEDTDGDISGLTVGDVISRYINTFDQALKTYFDLTGSGEDPTKSMEQIYQNYRKGECFV